MQKLDLTNRKIGMLTVVEEDHISKSGHAMWKLSCKCGSFRIARASVIQNDEIYSCGCIKRNSINDRKRLNLINEKHGLLTVIKEHGTNKSGKSTWISVCGCGNNRIVVGSYFLRGVYHSCGCVRKEVSKIPLEYKFLKKIKKTPYFSDCWEWSGRINDTGYGSFSGYKTKTILAHRFSWEFHNGKIPKGLFVCHHCDNRNCCNPFHLFLGTHQDNMNDMIKKGRNAQLFGERHKLSKLTNANVEYMRRLYSDKKFTVKMLSEIFNISMCQCNKIVKYKAWKHIKPQVGPPNG